MSTRREIRERWERILQKQQSSGLSVSAFCRQTGVQCSGYYKWRRKLGRQALFSEVRLKADSTAVDGRTAAEIELYLPGRRSIAVRPGFDRQTLLELLAVLETSPVAAAATRETGA
jgi:transposase-like protein